MNELEKLELKRSIYENNEYILSDDSINSNVLNCEFDLINSGQYNLLKQAVNHNAVVTTDKRENSLLNRLFNRNKVILSSV